MADVTVRSTRADDVHHIIEISHAVSPQYPRPTVEEYIGRVNSVPSGAPFIRFVAEQDGSVLGYGDVLQMFWTDVPGSFQGTIQVRPDRQGQGVGSRLYEHLMGVVQAQMAERVYGKIKDDKPETLHFVERRGWRPTGFVERRSRLDVATVNLDGYQDLAERLAREGIRVTTLADLGADDEQVLRRAYSVDLEYSRDMPSSEPYSMPFEQWHEFISTSPGYSLDFIFVALEGSEIIGSGNLELQGGNAAFHAGLGVLRAYRGRGVARLLKLQQIKWSQTHGIDYLYTGNDIANPRMYDINVRLGYQPLPSEIEVLRSFIESSVPG